MAPYTGDTSTRIAAKPVAPPEPGFSAIYRNAVEPYLNDPVQHPAEIFRAAVAAVPGQRFIGRRKWDFVRGDFSQQYTWTTYAEASDQVHSLGHALSNLLQDGTLQPDPESGLTAALWSPNVPEFQIIMQQTHVFSRRLVNIFDSFPLDSVLYVLAHSEAQVVFTTGVHLAQLLPNLDQLPKVKAFVVIDEQPPAGVLSIQLPPTQASKQQIAAAWAQSEGARVFVWEDLLALGKAKPLSIPTLAGLDHVPLLCYTSGSTGVPKGALVSSRQLSFASTSINKGGPPIIEYERVLFSYLPVAHIYEVLLETMTVHYHGAIGYSCGDTTRLLEDMQILSPHVFPSVPRVLNRIASQIELQMRGDSFKAKLLRRAVESKMAYHDEDGQVAHAFWDRLIFRKVQALLGGNVQIIISGSAPIRPETIKLLRVCFATDVREGFGATENMATATLNLPYDKELGSVGAIAPGLELRLQDQPELGYFATDKPRPRGEILLRGPSVFPGYFKDPEKTAETLDADGWLHTGDVGAIDERGRLYIIDRIKNLIKLSQGEYVAVEATEQAYTGLVELAQLFVYGDSLSHWLALVAVPDPGPFAAWVSKLLKKDIRPEDVEPYYSEPVVVKEMLRRVQALGRAQGLNGIQIVKNLYLTSEAFTPENVLTPTFKLRRNVAYKHFKPQLEKLYAEGPLDI